MKLTDYASFVERDKEGLPLPEPIPLSSLTEMVHRWKPAIKHHEHASIYYYQTSALYRRLMQLSHHPEIYEPLLSGKELVIVNAAAEPLEDFHDIARLCTPLTGLSFVVAVLNSEQLLRNDTVRFIESMELMSDQEDIVFLFFFTTNFLHPDTLSAIKSSASFRNTIFHPLPTTSDADQFVTYLSKKWTVAISRAAKHTIISASGNHFLLIKQLVRQIRDGQPLSLSIEHEDLRAKVHFLWNTFAPSEQEILTQSVLKGTKTTAFDRDSVAFLVKSGFIRSKKKSYQITIPLLADYIRFINTQAESLTKSPNGHIYLKGVPVKDIFSPQEYQTLQLLVANAPRIVSRERIAQAIWGTTWDEHYSSWAIDKLISKIRHKITRLGISPNLSTHKGAGYSYATKPL